MANNQLLPFGTAGGANVLDYATYSAGSWRLTGFTAGTALSQQLNTVWRQGSFAAAMIGQYVADYSNQNVNDDGDVATFEANFIKSLAYPIQNKKWNGFDDTGTADAIAITPVPAPTGYVAYQTWWIKKGASANATTTPTLNVAGLGAKTLVRSDGSALAAGDLIGSGVFEAQYDGTSFRVLTNSQQAIKRLALKRTRVTFATTGSFSWTVPAGVTIIYVRAWSGGGGGGWGTNVGTGCASGGSAGSYFECAIDVAPGASVTGSVGVGGAGSGSSSSGGQGGATSVTYGGSTWSATGGPGGLSSATSGANSPGTGSVGIPNGFGIVGGQGNGGFNASGLVMSGAGGSAPNGGQGGVGGAGVPSAGAIPGGGGGGSGSGAGFGGSGARGEVWIEY